MTMPESRKDDIIAYICRQFDVPVVRFGTAKHVVLTIRDLDLLILDLQAERGGFLLFAELGPLGESPLEVACALLRENHPERATTGITFGLVPDNQQVSISGLISFEAADFPTVYRAVSTFADKARAWAERLSSGGADGLADALAGSRAEPGWPARPLQDGSNVDAKEGQSGDDWLIV